MTGSDIIYEVSRDLNDQVPGHEYTRWTVSQLQSYLREALGNVSAHLKDLFTSTFVVNVRPGTDWQKACDCSTVLRILGETTPDGQIIRYLHRSEDVEANVWPGPAQPCKVYPSKYVMNGYMVSAVDDSQFKVTPPVPPGMDKYVLVECYQRPTSENLDASVPEEVEAIVKQWMLYRALSVDSENNPTIIDLAAKHKQTYLELLQAALLTRALEDRDGNNVRAVQKSST